MQGGYFLGILRSYWAAFGWGLILVEPVIYLVAGLVFLLALLGIVAAMQSGGAFWHAPGPTRRGLTLLALAFAMNATATCRRRRPSTDSTRAGRRSARKTRPNKSATIRLPPPTGLKTSSAIRGGINRQTARNYPPYLLL